MPSRKQRRRREKTFRHEYETVLLDAPDWRYLAYHLAGDIVSTVIKGGTVAYRR